MPATAHVCLRCGVLRSASAADGIGHVHPRHSSTLEWLSLRVLLSLQCAMAALRSLHALQGARNFYKFLPPGGSRWHHPKYPVAVIAYTCIHFCITHSKYNQEP